MKLYVVLRMVQCFIKIGIYFEDQIFYREFNLLLKRVKLRPQFDFNPLNLLNSASFFENLNNNNKFYCLHFRKRGGVKRLKVELRTKHNYVHKLFEIITKINLVYIHK